MSGEPYFVVERFKRNLPEQSSRTESQKAALAQRQKGASEGVPHEFNLHQAPDFGLDQQRHLNNALSSKVTLYGEEKSVSSNLKNLTLRLLGESTQPSKKRAADEPACVQHVESKGRPTKLHSRVTQNSLNPRAPFYTSRSPYHGGVPGKEPAMVATTHHDSDSGRDPSIHPPEPALVHNVGDRQRAPDLQSSVSDVPGPEHSGVGSPTAAVPPGSGLTQRARLPSTLQSLMELNSSSIASLEAENSTSISPESSLAFNMPRDKDDTLLLQPETQPITQEQLVNEVKGIYAGLVMVEKKCVEIDQQQSETTHKLSDEQWQALIALHRTLLHEHHDFFLASQHPSSSPTLRRIALKYAMPARMWRHGIHSFLELLRRRLPDSLDHMLAFVYLAYSMMALLMESVPSFKETWIECLGDLARYRMAIEEADLRDRELWSGVARMWYNKAADKSPNVGRIQHRLAVLARPNIFQQLFYYSKALVSVIPFPNTRESIMLPFYPFLEGSQIASQRYHSVDSSLARAHAILFTNGTVGDLRFGDARFLEPEDAAAYVYQHLGEIRTVGAQHIGDKNILPFMHVTLAYLLRFAFVLNILACVEGCVPWKDIAIFLDALGRSGVVDTDIESTNFLQQLSGIGRPLPEDFTMPGLTWAQHYFPPDFFSDQIVDEDEWNPELPSHAAPRAERCHWLGVQLASLNRWMHYDNQSKQFSMARFARLLASVNVSFHNGRTYDTTSGVQLCQRLGTGELLASHMESACASQSRQTKPDVEKGFQGWLWTLAIKVGMIEWLQNLGGLHGFYFCDSTTLNWCFTATSHTGHSILKLAKAWAEVWAKTRAARAGTFFSTYVYKASLAGKMFLLTIALPTTCATPTGGISTTKNLSGPAAWLDFESVCRIIAWASTSVVGAAIIYVGLHGPRQDLPRYCVLSFGAAGASLVLLDARAPPEIRWPTICVGYTFLIRFWKKASELYEMGHGWLGPILALAILLDIGLLHLTLNGQGGDQGLFLQLLLTCLCLSLSICAYAARFQQNISTNPRLDEMV